MIYKRVFILLSLILLNENILERPFWPQTFTPLEINAFSLLLFEGKSNRLQSKLAKV